MSDAASLPQRILMTTDTVSATWQYAMQLGTEFTRRGIETALATLGELPSAQQRSEAERAGVQLYVSRHKLEWMDDFWVDDERAGDWLLGLEDEFKPDLVHLNGYVHGALPWRAPHVVVAHDCVLSRWEALYGTAPPPTLARYQSAVRLALQRSRFVVAPSRTMLAALTGRALILGDIASQRELWEGAALFVDPHDPQALAAAANGLIANPKRRSVMMALARQRAPRYSVRAMVAAYLQLYRSMLVEEEKPAAVAYTVEQRLYAV